MAVVEVNDLREKLMRERKIGRTSLEAMLEVIQAQVEIDSRPLGLSELRCSIGEPIWDSKRKVWGILEGVTVTELGKIVVLQFKGGSDWQLDKNRFYKQKVN